MAMLDPYHPVLARWFTNRFGEPTDVQKQAWPLITAGRHTLITAPTGSGKTLAALMPLINRVLLDKISSVLDGSNRMNALQGEQSSATPSGVRILYVTPLKALNNDIRQHLFEFADEWQIEAERSGERWPGITVGVRTGDTTQSTRASMLRRPPDVLITTPESLYILLTSKRAREMLRSVQYIVIDEIHDLAASERGVHLSLSLERLHALCDHELQRIGVSATVNPMDRIARFLGGWKASDSGSATSAQRPVAIVHSPMKRPLEVTVTIPNHGLLIHNKHEDIWKPLVDEILRHMGMMSGSEDDTSLNSAQQNIDARGTTLIFVGNRRLCERLSARLNEACGEGFCRSHHGSVSRERRLETEQLMREGKLRCIVATSSLELGIDIGDVDQVLQIDTPYTATAGIQRFGRSGHAVGGTSRGTIIVLSRGLLPEIAVLASQITRKLTEPIELPRYSAAVLAQQITAIVAHEEWHPDDLYRLITQSDAYQGFPRERFDEVVDMLCGAYPFVRALIERDTESGLLRGRPSSAVAAVIGSGTIPTSANFPVYHAESRVHLGELNEEYVFESRVGDVFQLGAANWRIHKISADRVEVSESHSPIGEIPFWRAEGQGRSFELSLEIGRLMERLDSIFAASTSVTAADQLASDLLISQHHFTSEAARSLAGLIQAQRAVSAWPTHRRIVIEWYTDDSGLTHVVIHSWFGRRFNRTWLLALVHHLQKSYPHEVQTSAKDNGIELLFRVWDPLLLDQLRGVNSETIEQLLLEAVPASPMFAARFRQLAETSLLLARGFQRTPSWLKRLRGEELLREVMSGGVTSFPLVKEALRECMEQQLDLHHVRQVLQELESGQIELRIVKCARPSPLASQFFFDFMNIAVYESDALTRDLRDRMSRISKELAAEVFGTDVVPEDNDGANTDDRRRLSRDQQSKLEHYLRYLQIKHYLDPSHRLEGSEGVLQALTKLQGLFLPLTWWEGFLLPSRVSGYRREDLDLLCASGDLIWIGRKDEDASEGKIAFFRMDALELVKPFLPEASCEPRHPELYELLRRRGASFLTQLVRDTGEEPSTLLRKLLDLVWQGLATNDQFAPVRMHGLKRAAVNRGTFRSGLGRWYATVDLAGDQYEDISTEQAVLAWTRHLLELTGVITKSVVQSYSPFPWEVHLAALTRMEELGVITRGFFVRDIHALQFADRQTAERLRELVFAGSESTESEEGIITISSADPANPYGLVVDWPASDPPGPVRFARKPSNFMLIRNGRFLMWAGHNGRKIVTVDEQTTDPSLQAEYIRFTARSLIRDKGLRKVKIESWNDQPISRTELADQLAKLGAERDGHALVLWPSNV